MDIFKGKGVPSDRPAFIKMLDKVFFLTDTEEVFMRIHPKLYKAEYSPCEKNYIIKEDGVIKAAVGLFPLTVCAAGKTLRAGGIGNVAVTEDCRGKGYMIDCMDRAIEDMMADGTDYSILGGNRQRYGYFGFEPAGLNHRFRLNRTNIDHVLSRDAKSTFTAVKVSPSDKETLLKIKQLHETTDFYCEREDEKLFDILATWNCVTFAAFENGEFKGYFVKDADKKGIRELKPVNSEDLLNLIMLALETAQAESIELNYPPCEKEICEQLTSIAAECLITQTEMISIYNYKPFIDAFLSLKAKTAPLSDGELVMLIHGAKRDEQLKIKVENGCITVTETAEKPDVELEHREAQRLLCALYSSARNNLPAFAQSWFPLHFYSYTLDDV